MTDQSATQVVSKTPRAPAPQSRVLTPSSQLISIEQNDASKVFRHLYPALVLSLLYFGFSQLVKDPVEALTQAIAPITILQLLYCVICLPPFSGNSSSSSSVNSGNNSNSTTSPSSPSSTSSNKAPKRKRVQFAKQAPTIWNKIIVGRLYPLARQLLSSSNLWLCADIVFSLQPAILSLLLTFSLAVPLVLVLLICHGAPLTTHLPHTLLCATHMSTLAVLPLFYVHGVDSRMWREVCGIALPFDEVWGGSMGAVVGAWLGAVPIPLDWDREWQKWPVTIVTGVVLGWSLGRFGGEWAIRGRRIDLKDYQGEGEQLQQQGKQVEKKSS